MHYTLLYACICLYSKWQAIQTQFVTAIAAFIGTYIGLQFQKNPVAEQILLALTAGGFLYVASVNIVPTILADKSSSISEVVYELVAFSAGVAIMVLYCILYIILFIFILHLYSV